MTSIHSYQPSWIKRRSRTPLLSPRGGDDTRSSSPSWSRSKKKSGVFSSPSAVVAWPDTTNKYQKMTEPTTTTSSDYYEHRKRHLQKRRDIKSAGKQRTSSSTPRSTIHHPTTTTTTSSTHVTTMKVKKDVADSLLEEKMNRTKIDNKVARLAALFGTTTTTQQQQQSSPTKSSSSGYMDWPGTQSRSGETVPLPTQQYLKEFPRSKSTPPKQSQFHSNKQQQQQVVESMNNVQKSNQNNNNRSNPYLHQRDQSSTISNPMQQTKPKQTFIQTNKQDQELQQQNSSQEEAWIDTSQSWKRVVQSRKKSLSEAAIQQMNTTTTTIIQPSIKGYRGYFDKTKDLPSLADDTETVVTTTTATGHSYIHHGRRFNQQRQKQQQLFSTRKAYYRVDKSQVKQLVRAFRKMAAEEHDAKKAFALLEMRSRVMESDIQRGWRRNGGTVMVDDIVLTPYYQASHRIRDAVIVSKAWREGANPQDVCIAYSLTNPHTTISSTLDDTSFSLLRCASTEPNQMKGFQMFTLSDCNTMLLQLAHDQCQVRT